MKPGLLLARTPDKTTGFIRSNVALLDTFEMVHIHPTIDKAWWNDESASTEVKISEMIETHHVTHAFLWTPNSSRMFGIAKTCRGKGVSIVWGETFPGRRMVMDRLGCQYTPINEIGYERLFEAGEVGTLPTRLAQPPERPKEALWREYGCERRVVVFGQVMSDHSLLEQKGLPYRAWLDTLFRQNPETTFLFKQHPVLETPHLGRYANVQVIMESVASLFEAYPCFAAYGSTTILEGLSRGRSFVSGGQHFASGGEMTLHRPDGSRMEDIYAQLEDFKPDVDQVRRRVSFVANHYTIPPTSSRVLDRLLLSSDEFFNRSVKGE